MKTHTTRTVTHKPRISLSFRTGFTVLELLVTVAIITVLLALILPAIHAVRESARDIQCRNNLRQMGIALHSFHETHRRLPAGWKRDTNGLTAFGWASQILPQLEGSALVAQIEFRHSVDATTNFAARAAVPAIFQCPSDNASRTFLLFPEDTHRNQKAAGLSKPAHSTLPRTIELPAANYVGVFGTSDPDADTDATGTGVFIQDRAFRFADLQRGQSNTFLVGERTARKLPSTWLGIVMAGEDAAARVTGFADRGPNQSSSDECEFDSRHFSHVNFLYGDGHVQAIHDSVDRSIYRDLAKRHQRP